MSMLPPHWMTPNPLSGLSRRFLDQRRERRSPCAFGDIVCVGIDDANRLRDFIVGDADDACRATFDDFEWLNLRIAACHPVGERLCRRRRHRPPGFERQREGRCIVGHDTDYLRLEPEQIAHGDQAADAGAHADRDIDDVQIRPGREQFVSIGRNTLHEIAVK